MKVSLKSYNDLGKCAYATLMDEFDSEKDEIRLDGKKVEINTIDDLFQFLWNIPGIASHDNVKHTSVSDFYSTGTWWEHRYGESIENGKREISKLEMRLKKLPTRESRRSSTRLKVNGNISNRWNASSSVSTRKWKNVRR